MRFFYIFTSILLLFSATILAQPANKSVPLPKPIHPGEVWIDSVYKSLTIEQKIAQLFMVAAYSGGEKYNKPVIDNLVSQYQIGGLIFMQGTAEAQAEHTNAYQKMSTVPLLIGMDAEWGLGMRLKGVDDYPRQIMMGAMQDPYLVYKLGECVAKQCKRMGVHVNFAPVVDVNNNPGNPVINFRSFGEDKYLVSNYAIQYMKGMQDAGVLACAKHFPGHGNTATDSHKDLPLINGSMQQLKETELYPFQQLIKEKVASIMIAHLQVPAIEPKENVPTTLSYKTVTGLLRKDMGYNGLIFTDALNMKGVTKYYKPGEVDLKAFEAGNDVLLFSEDVPKGIAAIKTAIEKGIIKKERLEFSVKKILQAKYAVGLTKYKDISATNATADVNKFTDELRLLIAKQAITLLTDKNNVIEKLATKQAKKVAYVGVGLSEPAPINTYVKNYGAMDQYFLNNNNVINLEDKLKNYDAVIVGIHGMALYPGDNFKINATQLLLAQKIANNNNALVVIFGNPYAAKNFCNTAGVIVAYDERIQTQQIAADIILGKWKAHGTLPVTVCDKFKFKDGIKVSYAKNEYILSKENIDGKGEPIQKVDDSGQKNAPDEIEKEKPKPVKLTYNVAATTLNADIAKLNKIDALINEAIADKVMPGCRVLIAKDGNVFYNKSFGYTNPNTKTQRVNNSTMYDLASVTKVLATTLAVMKLYEQGKINLNNTLGDYLPKVRGTNKSNAKIKDVLMHQAGFKDWIPFYRKTLDTFTKAPRSDIYTRTKQGDFTLHVANNLFMNRHYLDTMWQTILTVENGVKKFEYSDLDFILLQKVVEKITGKPLDEYVKTEFYSKLKLNNITYNPLSHKVPLSNIAPTANDAEWRMQVVQGYVHDMAAAMFGGVSGHAGLFGTAEDCAVLMQMLLNGGEYNGVKLFKESTIKEFTTFNSNISNRGLGWDKQKRSTDNTKSYTADACTLATFGHTGFTGTCVWADPGTGIVFIFLSNRTMMGDTNYLSKKGIRTKAQQLAYESLGY